MPNIEHEIALIVRNENPALIFQEIAELKWLHPYKLEREDTIRLRDTYYDTSWKAIKRGKSSLRTREIFDGPDVAKTLVTLKGAKIEGLGRIEQEFEWPFPEEMLEQLIELFELEPIQVRTNLRTPMRVIKTSSKEQVAELVLDRLTYHFAEEKKVTLYEVEVEAKKNGYDIKNIVKPLAKKFPDLQEWEHSKLTMGHAIAVAMQVQTDDTGKLTPAAFDALDILC